MTTHIRNVDVADALQSAAASYAFALDAVRDDVACSIGALSTGQLRQLSSNGSELLVRYGELAGLLELARKALLPGEIRTILEGATSHLSATSDNVPSRRSEKAAENTP